MARAKNADFLVEIGTEELPPKALRGLRDAFAAGVVAGLENESLSHGEIRPYASPRRLALLVTDLASGQDDREVTQKGPPVKIAFDESGNATKAGVAFASRCGVDISELERQKTDAGEWLSHTAVVTGASTAELLPAIVQKSLDGLPIPRRMRWGASDAEFVRPVHWVVMLLGKDVVECEFFGVPAGNKSRGHRFHAPGEISIPVAGKYADVLAKKACVVADFDARRETIVEGVQGAAEELNGAPLGDSALYDEVAALTEWPVCLGGSFAPEFLTLPKEAVVATLTSHQRYFPVEDKDGRLLPAFITVANIESTEPDRVRDGNERVISPRLADAAFFWQQDQETSLADRADALDNVVYQQGLGSLSDKAGRVAALAGGVAEAAGADKAATERAALLAKCDLLTGMVGEFPELQGTMGGYYAAAAGEPASVALAIGEHYRPAFAGDELPASAEGQALAIADKVDTLAGIFALGKKPSGNRDPFGLRRAALGTIRILLEKNIDLDIGKLVSDAIALQPIADLDRDAVAHDLREFFVDRLRGYLLDTDATLSADMFAAVRSREPSSLLDFAARLRAVQSFMSLDEAISLAAANKRTANILRQASADPGSSDAGLLEEEAEVALHGALLDARAAVTPLIEKRNYTDALRALAALRGPVDAFFDDVMVMAEDEGLRNNRLAMLAELRSLFLGVADISRLTPAQE